MNPAAEEQIQLYGLKPEIYILLSSIVFSLVVAACLTRFYIRACITRSFGADDWVLVVTLIVFAGDIATVIKSATLIQQNGIVSDLTVVSAYDFASMLMYLVDQILLKVSIGLFFLRIPQQKWQLLVIKVVMIVYAVYSISFFFAVLFECGSPTGFDFVFGTCWHWNIMGPLNYIAACLNAIVDWIFVLMPILVVSSSMMKRKARLQVCAVIMLGACGSVVSVARIPLIKDLRIYHSFKYFGTLVPIVMCSVVETGVGMIAISLATFKPLVSMVKAGKDNSQYRSENYPHSPRYMSYSLPHIKTIDTRTADTKTIDTENIKLASVYEV